METLPESTLGTERMTAIVGEDSKRERTKGNVIFGRRKAAPGLVVQAEEGWSG